MSISQKCQYALRAVFELGKRSVDKATTGAEIAEAQAIPPRFLELILGQLRQGGFVVSRRGVRGGYFMANRPSSITVGDIIRFIDGPFAPVKCIANSDDPNCPLHAHCAFTGLWSRARDAVAEVYDQTSIQDLIDEEAEAHDKYVASYNI